MRFYLSEVLPPDAGTESPDGEKVKDYYRAAIDDALPRVAHSAEIPVDAVTGIPTFSWALVFADARSGYAGADADPRNILICEVSDESHLATLRWGDLPAARRARVLNRLSGGAGVLGASESLRQAIGVILRALNPAADERALRVRR